jgi:hypothetical protein
MNKLILASKSRRIGLIKLLDPYTVTPFVRCGRTFDRTVLPNRCYSTAYKNAKGFSIRILFRVKRSLSASIPLSFAAGSYDKPRTEPMLRMLACIQAERTASSAELHCFQ